MRKSIALILLAGLAVAACAPAVAEAEPVEPAVPTTAPKDQPEIAPSPEDTPPAGAEAQFSTDFSVHAIPYTEILSGGPPKDGIPPIDNPDFVSIAEADEWLEDLEAVVVVEIDGTARAYPAQILMWHEIVNDELNGQPVSVTYCPLCNTAIAFDRNFGGEVLDFGTTGRLRFSNLIMYDRQTETWWQQATGEGIVGELTGETLTTIPAFLVSWEDFKQDFPDGDVLSRKTGHSRDYGRNPYIGYDAEYSVPFLYRGPDTPEALPPLARVLTIDRADETVAFPYSVLEVEGAVNESVAGEPVVVFWQAGTASALDNPDVAGGEDVGSATSFSREVDGQVLTFAPADDGFEDAETGSRWNQFGLALDGQLAGTQLTPVVSINHFWFSWAAFRPDTRIYGVEATASAGSESEGDPAETAATVVDLPLDFPIALYQGMDALGGDSVAFSTLFTGKPVVAVFYAGLCPVCRFDLPLVEEAYRTRSGDMNVVAIDVGSFAGLGDEEDGKQMLNELGIEFPAGTLTGTDAILTYRVLGTPSFYFFNANGGLVTSWSGKIDESLLNAYLAELGV